MKIGILTYHRAENYGALLQAYALKTYLSSMGHDVSFVDYWPDYHKEYFELFSFKRFLGVGLRSKLIMLYYLLFYFVRKQRKQNLQDFICNHLGLGRTPQYTNDKDVCVEFDLVFYGSDQIWRKQGMPSHPGFDYWYLGSNNIQAKKKIAYAASMGNVNLDNNDREKFKELLKQFSALSVREDSLQQIVSGLGYKCEQVIDPVFLLNKEHWLKLSRESSEKQDRYILVYNLLGSNETVQFAETLSKKYNLPIAEISKKYGIRELGKRYNHTAKIEDFLSLIENAEYVVSNSFHGVAFSIIFEKQFYAVGMGQKSGRVKSLLKSLNLVERYVIGDSFIEKPIDFLQTKLFLEETITRSEEYINKSLIFDEGN